MSILFTLQRELSMQYRLQFLNENWVLSLYYLPTHEQHSLYKLLRQLKHSLQHEQLAKSHLHDCVIMHLDTIDAQTASLHA